MKPLALLLLVAACTPAKTRRTPDPQALRGVKLGVPPPADARPTPGIGCGQVSQDLPLRAHKVVGTDILHAAGLLWVAGFGHLIAGNVDTHALLWLLVGSIPGVLAGSQFTIHFGDRTLRLVLSLVLFASGAKLVEPNGYGWLGWTAGFVAVTLLVTRAVRLRDGVRVAAVARVD